MYDYKANLESLLKHKNGLKVHSINFVPNEVLYLTEREQLNFLNLLSSEPIFFSVDGPNYCKGGQLNENGRKRKGVTINIIELDTPSQIILIQDDIPIENSLTPEFQEIWNYMIKLTVLAHELGHVQDMQNGTDSNFSYTPPNVNLVEAEAYAHSYCLNYLHKSGAISARNTLANALYSMVSSNKEFEKQLFSSICNRIGKGRIKKWANI